MSLAQPRHQLELPQSLETQLLQFRRLVWTIKTLEAAAGALCGVLVGFLVMFGLDRIMNTPTSVRVGLFAFAIVACALIPLALHRWVWQHRRMEQLARLLRRRHPGVGDQLLGIIELVHSESEQARSRALCEAAIRQVADVAQQRDFRDSVPHPRHRRNAWLAGVSLSAALLLLMLFPSAAGNAWARFLMPWRDTPRYTFTSVKPLPEELVVPHGEPATVALALADNSEWRPASAAARLGNQHPLSARLREGQYTFELPGQIDPAAFTYHVGDLSGALRVVPTLRPELTNLVAKVTLPEYLGRPQGDDKDVRGGTISLVNGSQVSFVATVNRELQAAQVDGAPTTPTGAAIATPQFAVAEARAVQLQWEDRFGLAGREPFRITIAGHEDGAPSILCEELPRQKVLLDSEVLSFTLRAHDDFGVRQVGLEWQGLDDTIVKDPAQGERLLAAGGHDRESMEIRGTFSAAAHQIEPQPIRLRMFVEDYLPGRERVYSSPYIFYVLNAEQHAIWLTEQLSKWHRQSLEVRDRELQLFETNKAMRDLTTDELDQPDTRKRIEAQAAAERANGRRLSNLVMGGEDLVKQAMRNPEIGVGHLDKWAEMLQILKDISGKRMPSVADLLKDASQAPQAPPSQMASAGPPKKQGPKVGKIRTAGSGTPKQETPSDQKPPPPKPSISDVESSQLAQKPSDKPEEPKEGKPSAGKFGLPTTMLKGNGGDAKKPPAPAGEKLDEAVTEQQDLLAEFEKIADELNKVLANLEGSTLVKRLKAQSRHQYQIAGRLGDEIATGFGAPAAAKGELYGELAAQETKSSQDVSAIMDDMQAYFERRRFMQFQTVLNEMREEDVIGSLRQLGDDLRKESGLSIAQAEFWSDTLDRWAEDLVDPSRCGACSGCKSRGSLPPSIVLEVLQILEAEVNLREETRVAEQARPAIAAEEHAQQSAQLSQKQDGLRERIDQVIVRIREIPEGDELFAKEIALLQSVSPVMAEATNLLAEKITGKPTIAAETEAIELLLKSKRFNPKGGGGGGGDSPGGGGGGDTQDSALALVGNGVNDKEVREDRDISQATGKEENKLPEEFRAGLDEYFNRLESDGRP